MQSMIRWLSQYELDIPKLSIWIWSAIICDFEVWNILKFKFWDFIVFKNCKIVSTNADLNKYSIQQMWIFDNWVLQNNENELYENDFITRIFTSINENGELFYFNFKENQQLINLMEKYVLVLKKTNSFNFYLQRKLKLLITNFDSLEYYTENNYINIWLNPYSNRYSLLIKITQSNVADEYYVEDIWSFVIGTMWINILSFFL